MSSPDPQGAWLAAISAEQAAVYGYGALGPHLTDAGQITAAHTDESAHRALVDADAQTLAATGQAAPAPMASYPLPWPLTDELAAQQLAVRLEEATASAWRYLVASSSGSPTLRALGVTRLTAAAVRAVSWRRLVAPAAPTVPFPGI